LYITLPFVPLHPVGAHAVSAAAIAHPPRLSDRALAPVRAARVRVPVTCSQPQVDAVCMQCDRGLLIPLANYTLQPLDDIRLTVRSDRPITRVESVHRGVIPFAMHGPSVIEFHLPLGATDFVKCYY